MALAHVTFTQYFDYDVEVDDALYEEDPWAAEEAAIAQAYDEYCSLKRTPIADTTYDDVEVKFDGD